MRKSYVTIYDLQMRKVAYLENAFDIQYETPMNALWSASFSLPATDPKNEECKPLFFAEIFDESERIELFRILPSDLNRGASNDTITYQCEHVLGTLLDDIMFQYHTIGNLGVYTSQVLQYILSKQITQRWKLGTVEFTHQFEYNWENENLLGALFSVPKPFVDEYMWTWDTTTYPWTLNLVRPSNEIQAYIRYGVNMQGIKRRIDPSNVVTRIYGLGYGEGVNQLTFAEINGGKPYLDAEQEYIDRYGIMQTVFVDRRFQYPETLMARCQALLNELKQPRVTYVVQASELYALTKDPIDKFKTGAMIRVIDKEIGEDVNFRVQNVRKQDVIGAPGNVEIEIANRPQDIAGSIADLRNRQYVSEVYAQGATNIDTRDFADNCDPDHPAILRFYVPEETVRINKVLFNFDVEPFRAYSKAIEGGGSIVKSTSSGGGVVTSTSAGGASIETTSAGGDGQYFAVSSSYWWHLSPAHFLPADFMNLGGAHSHTVAVTVDGKSGTGVTSTDGSHVHSMYSVNHDHMVELPAHTHVVEIKPHAHGVSIPSHEHEINLPNHTHEIEYGIYQGPTPTEVIVKIDGNTVPGLGTNVSDIDIVPYLSKDSAGKIKRGEWHTIEIIPNSLGRIVASVVSQIFVQSRGGGNY